MRDQLSATMTITTMHDAAKTGSISTVKFLLEKGANIDARNDEGYTMLEVAISARKFKMVKLLLDRGAYLDSARITQIAIKCMDGMNEMSTVLEDKADEEGAEYLYDLATDVHLMVDIIALLASAEFRRQQGSDWSLGR